MNNHITNALVDRLLSDLEELNINLERVARGA